MKLFKYSLYVTGLSLALSFTSADVALAKPGGKTVTDFSLEELMNVEITTVAKKPQRVADTAGAVFVLTSEDIRRSGARTVPDLLRLVPGIHVAQLHTGTYAVSSRGFLAPFANKLLVLIDGRSVYSPVFSGVFWNEHDLMLEDIQQIEVIRGPGAAMWGANAVNGVINIITKSARNTQGTLISGGGGNIERGSGTARYGGMAGEDVAYRVYGKQSNRTSMDDPAGESLNDGEVSERGGFRVDWDAGEKDLVNVQGDVYHVDSGLRTTFPTLTPPFTGGQTGDLEDSGFNLLSRWEHEYSETSTGKFQMYYDRVHRIAPRLTYSVDTIDLDYQQTARAASWLDVTAGLGWRLISDDQRSRDRTWLMEPEERTFTLLSAFVQGDVPLIENELTLTVGSKVEHNDYTGFELQPNAKVLWTPVEHHSVWTTVARAVRIPSRVDNDIILDQAVVGVNNGLPTVATLFGSDDLRSENVLATELGYRAELAQNLSFDLAGFVNMYDDLGTLVPSSPFFDPAGLPHITVPLVATNNMRGTAHGVEALVRWRAMEWWNVLLSYTYLGLDLEVKDTEPMSIGIENEDDTPQNQFALRNSFDLPHDFELDGLLYYVDSIPNQGIDSNVRIDLRLGWHATKDLDLSFVVQNLFDKEHQEFGDSNVAGQLSGEVERSFFALATLRM